MKAPTLEELAYFTLNSYVRLLQYLRQIYKIVPFCEIPKKDCRYLILRHDIEFSTQAALKMARIERDLGIRSTYFVLFSSIGYNVLKENNVRILKQISKLDHEVGIHYDPSQFRSYGRNMNDTLKIEIQLLEHLLGKKVYSIARHGPWTRDPFATIKGYINANHPNLRRDLFIHESCRAWAPVEGIFQLLNDPPRRVQLLIHPENWQDDEINRENLLQRLIQNLANEALTFKKESEKSWSTDPLVLEYDNLMKKGNSLQFQSEKYKLNPTSKGKLPEELGYYYTLSRWYLINSPVGWRFHNMLQKYRKLGSPDVLR